MIEANKNLLSIQLLRGIACLLVLLFHTGNHVIDKLGTEFLGDAFYFGEAGVDIFFVLSGFIITYTNKEAIYNRNNTGVFIRKRLVRIFPVYWIVLVAVLALQVAFPSFFRTHFTFTFQNIIYSVLLLPGHNHLSAVGVSWTLTYELFFYLIFSFSFFVRSRKTIIILLSLLCIASITVMECGTYTASGNPWLRLLTSPLHFEFLMGASAALLFPVLSPRVSVPFIVLGTLLFLTGPVLHNTVNWLADKDLNKVIQFGIPSFFIITGLVKLETSRNIKIHRLLLLIGDASYSLYLLHISAIGAAIKLMAIYHMHHPLAVHIVVFATIGCIIAFSIWFHLQVEKPVINRLNRWWNQVR